MAPSGDPRRAEMAAGLVTLGGLARVSAQAVQEPLPDYYHELSEEETAAKLGAAKAALSDRLIILGHHYQRDEIIRWADYIGDSYKLAQYGAQRRDAEYIVFCGVHF